jgi:hypothetical protein
VGGEFDGEAKGRDRIRLGVKVRGFVCGVSR